MQILLNRFKSNSVSTIGRLSIADIFQCYVCEDAFHAVKIYGKTRIPRGRYEIKLKPLGDSRFDESYSRKFSFHKGMLQLQGVPGYTGVLIHIGNSSLDTDGCLLVGLEYTVTAAEDESYSVRKSAMAYEKIYPMILSALENEQVFIDVVDNDNPKETENEA